MSVKTTAQQVAKAMWAQDRASQWLGMELQSVQPGRAVLTLKVKDHHLNGHGMCHGGVTFALADSAFAFACNSRNQNTVAMHNLITFTAAAHLGDVLTAQAKEVSLNGRNGIYDVTVTRQDGTKVAEFRGMSRAIRGHVIEGTMENE